MQDAGERGFEVGSPVSHLWMVVTDQETTFANVSPNWRIWSERSERKMRPRLRPC